MTAPLDCAAIDSWEALLVALPPDERARYEQHLESCTTCQERLDRTEGGGESLLRLARQIGDPEPADPTLSHVIDRLREVKSPVRTAPVEPADLYFLRPNDKPEALGTLGAYEVQDVIGQGGMGVVLKAFDPALHRRVAIKAMAAAVAGSATARKRFTREAQAAAAVCHDNIVTVHGVYDTEDGLPYLVMQYVAGESLQARIDRVGPLELTEIVRIGLQTAAGLAAAHAQGLIHRDIKPANLLLENGLARVKITDFGLARTADDVGLTQDGVVAGTPEYMAPEQARGEPVDHRADLFSLGSVLYAICTGVPPFCGTSAVVVLRQVSDEAPTRVRALNPQTPTWMEALIARLLAKNPADRFQSAAEVAALLEGFLAHLRQPNRIRAPKLAPFSFDRCGENENRKQGDKVTRRRNVRRLLYVSLSACLLVCLLAAIGVGIASKSDGSAHDGESQPKLAARFHRDFHGASLDDPVLRPVGSGVETDGAGVRVRMPAGHGEQTPAALGAKLTIHGDFEITGSYEILRADQPTKGFGVGVNLYAQIDGETKNAFSLARRIVPDGKTLYHSDRMLLVDGKETHRVRPFPTDATSGKLRLKRVGPVVRYLVAEGTRPDFVQLDEVEVGTDDIRYIRFGGHTGGSESGLDLRLLDFTVEAEQLSGIPESALDNPGDRPKRWLVTAAILSSALALSSVGAWLYLRRRRHSGTAPGETPVLDKQTEAVAASPIIEVRCPSCGKNLRVKTEFAGKKGKCTKCGQVVAVPGPAREPAPIPAQDHAQGGDAARFVRNARLPLLLLLAGLLVGVGLLIAGNLGKSPDSAAARTAERRLSGHAGPVHNVLFTPDGGVVSGSGWPAGDKSVRVWDAASGKETLRIPVPAQVQALGLSSDGRRALAGLGNGTVLLLNIENGQTLKALQGHTGSVGWVAFDRDGQHAFSTSADGTARMWNLSDGKESGRFKVKNQRARGGAVFPDGRRLLTGDGEGLLQIWDVVTGKEVLKVDTGKFIDSLELTPDGKQALVAGVGGLRVFDLETAKEVRHFQEEQEEVHQAALSADGRQLLTGAFDGKVRLWDFQSGALLRVLGTHRDVALTVAFAPDGRLAVSGGGGERKDGDWAAGTDNDIRVWNLTAAATTPAAPKSAAKAWLGAAGILVLLLATSTFGVWCYVRQHGLAATRAASTSKRSHASATPRTAALSRRGWLWCLVAVPAAALFAGGSRNR
jgi:serine/threonine protein kinase/WD40 repeat protein/ribosomal protein L37AE/L43A